MARNGISYEQVAAAAEELTAKGEKITISNVREALGTGSPNTILRMLNEWRSQRPVEIPAEVVLPSSIADAINAEIMNATHSVRMELSGQITQLQYELIDAASNAEALERKLDNTVEQLAVMTDKASEADRLSVVCAQEREAADHSRIAMTKAEAQRDEALRAADKAAQDVVAITAQAKLANESNKSLEAEVRAGQQSIAVLTAQLTASVNSNAAANERIAGLELRLIERNSAVIAETKTSATLEGQLAALTIQMRLIVAERDSLADKLNALSVENAVLISRIKAIDNQGSAPAPVAAKPVSRASGKWIKLEGCFFRNDDKQPPVLCVDESDYSQIIETFPVSNGKQVSISEQKVSQYQVSYPDINVIAQLRAIKQWLVDNAKKRKPDTGLNKFINGWLARSNDKRDANVIANSVKAAPVMTNSALAEIERAAAAMGLDMQKDNDVCT